MTAAVVIALALSLLAAGLAIALLLAVLGLIRKIGELGARLDGVGVRVSWLEGVARGAERMRIIGDDARRGGRFRPREGQ